MKQIYFSFATAILIALWLGLVHADKTITIKALTAEDLVSIKIIKNNAVLQMCATYQLKDSLGNDWGNQKFFCKNLNPTQKSALIKFIRDDVLLVAGANAQEGM